MPILLIFLDGFGLGKPDNNPLFSYGLPCLEKLFNCKLLENSHKETGKLLLKPIDACLGIKGIPQSATGQTSLLTGQNAQALLGYHLPAFPNDLLINLIKSHSILRQVTELGLRATFANAYTDTYFEMAQKRKFKHSVTTNCVLSASLPFLTIDNLRRNEAVYWDITREHLISIAPDIKEIKASQAGMHLAAISAVHDFTLFECFATDIIGHSGSLNDSIAILDKINDMLDSCIHSMSPETTLLISSDHGNIEDLSISSHTTNPVPLIAIGPSAEKFRCVTRIDEITPAIIRLFKNNTTL